MTDAQQLLAYYPKIYFACHTRHVRDPESGRKLSAHQASILDHLDAVEPTGVTELARHMGVTPSTMSLNIDRLESKGYVKRSTDPDDARKVQLHITPAGLKVREAKSVLDPERVETLLAQMSECDRDEAIHGLALLADAAMKMMKKKSMKSEKL